LKKYAKKRKLDECNDFNNKLVNGEAVDLNTKKLNAFC